MLRKILFLALIALVVALTTTSAVWAWGGYHVGYTHYSPYTGVHHYGYTSVHSGYGATAATTTVALITAAPTMLITVTAAPTTTAAITTAATPAALTTDTIVAGNLWWDAEDGMSPE
jgi:hypothetical protein